MAILNKLVFVLFFTSTMASAFDVEADGKIFFKNKKSAIETLDASLNVPAKGEGEIVLQIGDKTYKTSNFSVRKKSERTILYVVFDKNQKLFGENKRIVFKGTYVRGTNLALYYGSFFISKMSRLRGKLRKEREYKYLGGFVFKKILNPQPVM